MAGVVPQDTAEPVADVARQLAGREAASGAVMKFERADKYSQKSTCGEYSVCAIGVGKGHFYEAWRTRSHKEGPHLISTNLASAAEARQACEGDASAES